jgi:uncharacterized membrane protein YdjX (TVP38/TMEM64 family)
MDYASRMGPPDDAHPWKRRARVGAALGLPLALLVVGRVLGWHEHLTIEGVRALVGGAGTWGVGLFVLSFCVGELVQVPGLVFVAAAVLFYGPRYGGPFAYVAALVSISVSFALVRAVAGRAGAPKPPPEEEAAASTSFSLVRAVRARIRSWMGRLETQPIRTIALLRLVLLFSPPLNYALALSRVRFRDYLLGSALGLLPPTVAAVALFDELVVWLK